MIIELTGTRRVPTARRCDHCSEEDPEIVLRSGETGNEECYHWECAMEAHPEMANALEDFRLDAQKDEVQP